MFNLNPANISSIILFLDNFNTVKEFCHLSQGKKREGNEEHGCKGRKNV